MPSTEKIVFSVIAFYFVVGLYNLSGGAGFITPYFLNYFVLLAVSLYASIINRKNNFVKYLWLYTIALLIIASVHSQTLSIFNMWVGISENSTITANELHKILSILVFYVLLIYIYFKNIWQPHLTNFYWTPLFFILVSITGVLLNDGLLQTLFLSAFMLSFILISHFSKQNISAVTSSINIQFLLFLVIENMRMLTTAV